MQRFRDVLSRWEKKELSALDASEILGCSERQFRRWRRRFEDEGLAGLFDKRLGKASVRRAPVDEISWLLSEYRSRYTGWTAKHFHEHLQREHGFRWSYTWTKTQLHAAGLVERAKRRGAHRRKRPRKPCVGMMLHQDGSRHAWLEDQPQFDLIVTMDDASSEIYSAFLVEEEGTASTFAGLLETFSAKGLPSSLYTDRGSHYFYTPEAGGKVDKSVLTQVGRALDKLGIEHIAAYSPEARGRSERMFSTLQDRLPKEMKLAGITGTEAANRFIREVYLPRHNARFACEPAVAESAFVAADVSQLTEVLCIEEERVVARDNTVTFGRLELQLPPSPIRHHYVKARVRVRQYPDGRLGVFHGPRCIGRYEADGQAIATPTSASLAACSTRSRRGLKASRPAAPPARRPALTASPLAASGDAWVGTEKRASRSNQETPRPLDRSAR